MMWLTGHLMQNFKTIANFRKDNGRAISKVCKQFVVLCQRLGLFSKALAAIDGSKSKASIIATSTSPAPSCSDEWKRRVLAVSCIP